MAALPARDVHPDPRARDRGLYGRELTMRCPLAGGGIVGLSLALSLHAAGIADIEVFERSRRAELGRRINVLPHALRN